MFQVRNLHFCLPLFAIFISCCAASDAAADPRTITLEVRLTTPAGSPPEADVPVTVTMCRRTWRSAKTDSSGVAHFEIEITDACEWLKISINQLSGRLGSATAEAERELRVQTLEELWSVIDPPELRLSPTETSYIVDFPLVPAIAVSGKVVAPSGQRRGVRIDRDGRFNVGAHRGHLSGEFQVTGVPKGRHSLLYMWVENHDARAMWIRIQQLSAAQAQQNLDLGTIVEDPPTEMFPTTVTVNDFRVPPLNRYPYGRILVAVRSDGKYAVPATFVRQAEALGPTAQSLTYTVKLPMGTWYFFPSDISELRMVPAIRRLLAGDTAAIDAANIPKVVVTNTQPPAAAPAVTIDFWPTLERMLTITPPSPPAPPPAPPAP